MCTQFSSVACIGPTNREKIWKSNRLLKCEEKLKHNFRNHFRNTWTVAQYVHFFFFFFSHFTVIINFQCKSCAWDVYLEFCKCSYLFNACAKHLSSLVYVGCFSFLFDFVMKEKSMVGRLVVACRRRDAFNKFVDDDDVGEEESER